MSERYVKGLVLVMLRKLVQRFGPATELAGDLFDWLGNKGWMIGIRLDDEREMKRRWRSAGRIPNTDWSRLKDQLDSAALPRTKSILRSNLELLGRTFHLDTIELDILEVGVLCRMSHLMESFLDTCFEGRDLVQVVAALLGATRDAIHRRLT